MAVRFNHTIISAQDSEAAAEFLASILGLAPPTRYGRFVVVALDNGVSLDFLDTREGIPAQHYAFLVDEAEFDDIFGRIRQRASAYWADPGRTRPGEINHRDGGRGVYFEDPNGHLLEILTRAYGSAA